MGDLTSSQSSCNNSTVTNIAGSEPYSKKRSSCDDLQAFVQSISSPPDCVEPSSSHQDVKPLDFRNLPLGNCLPGSSCAQNQPPGFFPVNNGNQKSSEHQIYLDALVSTLKEDTALLPTCSQSVNNEKLDINVMSTQSIPQQEALMQDSFFQPQYTEAHFNYTSDTNTADVLSTRNPSDIVGLLNQSYFTIDNSNAALRLLSFLATQGNLHILDENKISNSMTGSETGMVSGEKNSMTDNKSMNTQHISFVNVQNQSEAINMPDYYDFSETAQQNFSSNTQLNYSNTDQQNFPNGLQADVGTFPTEQVDTLLPTNMKGDMDNDRSNCEYENTFPSSDLLNFNIDYSDLGHEG